MLQRHLGKKETVPGPPFGMGILLISLSSRLRICLAILAWYFLIDAMLHAVIPPPPNPITHTIRCALYCLFASYYYLCRTISEMGSASLFSLSLMENHNHTDPLFPDAEEAGDYGTHCWYGTTATKSRKGR